MTKKILSPLLFIILFAFFINCNSNSDVKENILFENIIELEYAKGLSIYQTNEGYVVTVKDPITNQQKDHFLVTKNKNPKLSIDKVITLPINNVLAYSSTYISFIDKLGETNKIKGVTYSQGISNLTLKKQLQSNITIDVGSDQDPDKEMIVSLNPDLALIYPSNGNHDWLESFDIPTITNMEYLEVHPLAQVEWIKLYGILFDKVKESEAIFEDIKNRYLAASDIAKSLKNQPVVLCGELYNDVWTLPGGKSTTAQLISDAGGVYFYEQDSSSGSKKVDFEYILTREKDIDFWLLLTYNQKPVTFSSLKEDKPRYSYLSVFSPEKIGICNTATSPYFETGVMEPHILLNEISDLIHQQKLGDSTKYFKKI